MLRTRILSSLVLALGLLGSQSAHAWWNDEWAFRKELTFNLTPAGADVASNVQDVPVLVRLSLANFTYFNDAKPDGSDLRFIAADDKTPLKFHVEKFDAQSQIALIWVRVPQLTGGAEKTDKVYLYYGNPKATDGADAAGSYDGTTSLVYHFAAPVGSPQDSASYKNEPAQLTAEANTASLIGNGVRFSADQVIAVNAAPSLTLKATTGMTLSAWVRPEATAGIAQVVGLEEGTRAFTLAIESGRAVAHWRDGSRDVAVRAATDLTEGWHHLAVRASSGKLTLFVDGSVAGESAAPLADLAGRLIVGATAAGGSRYVGDLDELQVANAARSDGWIRASARSQGMDAPLLVYGDDAQKESGASESYFTSTLRNVTVDGWVIIGVLAVMFVASTLIMIFKIIYLNRIASGNVKFMADYQSIVDDPASLESRANQNGGSPYGQSTLWRLYRLGMAEAHKRIDPQQGAVDGAQQVIGAPAIEAIRATLDASQTRMGQSLGNQMVWLTISISGGPFLGLLGTVVGVMITFAAIAAAGEVNVNAIAPGTAAALVATTAGLAVAIPCLFGYNYLNTRIKEITTDMRVFVDELVARLAETYS